VIFALLPVKPPDRAKQRLSRVLEQRFRETLARAMYEHVLSVLCASSGLDRIAVMTADQGAADQARRSGAMVFDEPELLGHKKSADLAARRAMCYGARTVIMVPIDVPLIAPADIEELTAAARAAAGPCAFIVPSWDRSGTNALVLTPPDAMQTCFGENSLRGHLEQARARGIPIRELHPPGLALDIDTPEDIAELLARAPESKIARLLEGKCPSGSRA